MSDVIVYIDSQYTPVTRSALLKQLDDALRSGKTMDLQWLFRIVLDYCCCGKLCFIEKDGKLFGIVHDTESTTAMNIDAKLHHLLLLSCSWPVSIYKPLCTNAP